MNKKRFALIAVLLVLWVVFQLLPNGNIATLSSAQSEISEHRPTGTINGKEISITLDKVITDLNNAAFVGSVRGKDKIVAVELKQDLPDSFSRGEAEQPGTDLSWGMRGLWIGETWWSSFRKPFAFSVYHELDLTKPQYYLIFYTSRGEALYHEVSINPKLQDSVREVLVDSTVELNGQKLIISEIRFGLTQTVLEFKADNKVNQMEFTLTDLTTGEEFKSRSYSAWGGGQGYEGLFGFDNVVPLPAGAMKLTIRQKDSGIEKSINILP